MILSAQFALFFVIGHSGLTLYYSFLFLFGWLKA